jgi:DNA-3-methyladenine glycosylase I
LITISQRENFRAAFDQFDYKKIATYNDDKILDLLQDAGIIRNKLKVYSAVTNAQNFIKSKKNLVPSPNIFGIHRWKPLITKPKR